MMLTRLEVIVETILRYACPAPEGLKKRNMGQKYLTGDRLRWLRHPGLSKRLTSNPWLYIVFRQVYAGILSLITEKQKVVP
jgi:hypothetical protein